MQRSLPVSVVWRRKREPDRRARSRFSRLFPEREPDCRQRAAGRTLWRISIDAYSDLVSPAEPGADLLPLPVGAGSTFIDPSFEYEDPRDAVTGRIALFINSADGWGVEGAGGSGAGAEGGPVATLVVESREFGVACPLSRGQLHRLTNALSGRGTRSGVRPTATNGEFVHLTGSPERLIVEQGEWRVEVPAGPRRVLGWAMRNAETVLPS